jgi:hypothetical protein
MKLIRENRMPLHTALRIAVAVSALVTIWLYSQNISAWAAQKPGQSCSKLGSISNGLVCVKNGKSYAWQKGSQEISAQFPAVVSVDSGTFVVIAKTSSRLPVKVTSETPSICSALGNYLQPISAGYCSVSLTQTGNSNFKAAKKLTLRILQTGRSRLDAPKLAKVTVDGGQLNLTAVSEKGLPSEASTTSSDICSITNNVLTPKSIGDCSVTWTQETSVFYPEPVSLAQIIRIYGTPQLEFDPPPSATISGSPISLKAHSNSPAPVTFSINTPNVCSIENGALNLNAIGTCNVRASQSEADYWLAPNPIDRQIQITAPRTTTDQPDTISGFQIKPIYVLPSDAVDSFADTNGTISQLLDEGSALLKSNLGVVWPIDKTKYGYDIQFFRSSYTSDQLKSFGSGINTKIAQDASIFNDLGANRKHYAFFVQLSNLGGDSIGEGDKCGWGNTPGLIATVALSGSGECGSPFRQMTSWVSKTWVHEVLHTLGVQHTTDDPCDVMYPEGSSLCTGDVTIDRSRTRYFGSANQGVDISTLRVWDGYTLNTSLIAGCEVARLSPYTRPDGLSFVICPTGSKVIGPTQYCYSGAFSPALQEFVQGTWVSLGDGSRYSSPWGSEVDWACSAGYTGPWIVVKHPQPGQSMYRWMINGIEKERFNVFWQN